MATKRKSSILITAIIIVLILAVFIGALSLLRSVYQTETYYVLNQDVSTKTQITPEMLDPIVTSEGTAPPNTLTLQDVQDGSLFSQFPLSAGDVLLYSSVSGFTDISTGIPDNYVITSINVGADNASGGRITRGVYFDLMVYDGDSENDEELGKVFYPFVNILALDTTVSMDSASSQDAIDTEEAQAGQVSFYYIGVTPENAAYLELISQKYSGNIKLLLSPRQNEYQKPQISAYSGFFKFNTSTGEMRQESGTLTPLNLGENMDSTFTSPERDEFGRPIKQLKNCGTGNAFIPPDPETGACPATGKETTTTNDDTTDSLDIVEEENTPFDIETEEEIIEEN